AVKFVIEPYAVEELHERKIEYVDSHHRGCAVVAVVVPGAVRREYETAAPRFAALAFDPRIAAVLGQDGAARIGRMDVHRRHVARIVDRYRAPDGVRDLESAA